MFVEDACRDNKIELRSKGNDEESPVREHYAYRLRETRAEGGLREREGERAVIIPNERSREKEGRERERKR